MSKFKIITLLAGAVIIAFLVNEIAGNTPMTWYVWVFVIWFLLTALGSWFIRWNFHLTAIHHNRDTKENQIAITFDDGPNPEFTPQVLSLLKQFNAKATFFCIGKHIENNPDLLKKIIAEGHTVGNHTYSHSNGFGFFSSEKVVSELNKTNKAVKELTGRDLKMYRPAFGITNPLIQKAIKKTGFAVIGWSKRSFDTTNLSEEIILKRITKNLQKGDIILLHDSSAKSVSVLERLLLFLKTNKMQPVTVDELLEKQAYA